LSADRSKAVARRILSFMKRGERDKDFAARLGLSAQTISNYDKGTNGASVNACLALLDLYPRISGHWLLTGVEPKELPADTDSLKLAVIGKVRDGDVVGARELLERLAPTAPLEAHDESLGENLGDDDAPRGQGKTRKVSGSKTPQSR
jgi:transcriptional regulator with XRE-family HTH domain